MQREGLKEEEAEAEGEAEGVEEEKVAAEKLCKWGQAISPSFAVSFSMVHIYLLQRRCPARKERAQIMPSQGYGAIAAYGSCSQAGGPVVP